MPYIKKSRRNPIDLDNSGVDDPGELNFKLTISIVDYLEVHGLSYQSINDILGALAGAKAEFYHRVAVPYETKKRLENGDVYPEYFTGMEARKIQGSAVSSATVPVTTNAPILTEESFDGQFRYPNVP